MSARRPFLAAGFFLLVISTPLSASLTRAEGQPLRGAGITDPLACEVQFTCGLGGQTVSYSYDVFGNLRSLTLPDGIQIDYVIDAANRRVGKKVNGALVKGWLYKDQLFPVAELDGAGAIVSSSSTARRRTCRTTWSRAARPSFRIVSDHLGSVRLVVNGTDGSIAQRVDYDAFGRVQLDTNPGFQAFGFAGGLYDHQTGLVRFGARDYHAESGRWTSKDPIGFAGGSTGFYTYVGNDPLNQVDPSGLVVIFVHGTSSSFSQCFSQDFVEYVKRFLRRQPSQGVTVERQELMAHVAKPPNG